MAHGPLSGIRVLDLTRVVAGPFCTSLLGDLGAEVIKAEMPRRGDDARYGYPRVRDVPAVFLALNRNKKGITLNLGRPEGQSLVRRLLPHIDVLVENFAPGTMSRWGLGAEELLAEHPSLIYASLSGFGQTGPWARRSSYDIISQAASGFMSITGFPDGPPTRGGGSLGDYVGGLFAALGIVAAIHHRERTGIGQQVDVATMDSMLSLLDGWLTVFAGSGQRPPRLGNRHFATAPYDCFRARDGWVVIGVANNRLFRRLAEAMGQPELGRDPRFRGPAERLARSEELHALIARWVADRSVGEVLEALGPDRADVPCAPVLGVEELVAHPQVLAREMIVRLPHPELGDVAVPGIPIKLSASPGAIERLGPELGEHNDEIYRGLLGLGDEEIERLRAAEAI